MPPFFAYKQVEKEACLFVNKKAQNKKAPNPISLILLVMKLTICKANLQTN
jgi:hypothetical protein